LVIAAAISSPVKCSPAASTYSGQAFKHTLLPVWLLYYDYGRKSYQVVVNGVTGAIAGEQPYSWIKILLAVLAAIILVVIILSVTN